jgi:hypothetical protein
MMQRIFFLLVLHLAWALSGQASGPEAWSVDLKNYGFREWHESNGLWRSSDLRMATTKDAVAIALGNPSGTSQANDQSNRASADSQISLFILEARTGRLLSKNGPWIADRFFELFPTSQGNWLLLLRHCKGASEEPGETLLLLSPTGDELKKLFLAASILLPKLGSNTHPRPTWNIFLVSSSGHTVLIGQILADGVHYKLLEADTLETQSEWTVESGSSSPSVLALSDKELLGLGKPESPQQRGAGNDRGQLYVRPFAGSWIPFPVSLDLNSHVVLSGPIPNQLAFLSDHTLVGLTSKPRKPDAPITVARTDGTTVFSPVIPKLAENTTLSGPVKVAQDGRYFAVGFSHRPWLSHVMLDVWKMDMAFQPDELVLLVWQPSRPMPVSQVKLGSVYDVRGLSFVLDDLPSIASLGRNTLKVIPVAVR